MTPSEELVFKLCRQSFLSLWSYANPLNGAGKELCDVLVVCDPDVLIFSVKEIQAAASGNIDVDWKRWTRRAIEESAKQIYGAERWLGTASHVITSAGNQGLPLPDPAVRRVHRIAVALGSQGEIPIAAQDFGKGYVHVFEEGSLDILMKELDTITDCTDYLRAKETLLETTMVMVPGEENLLALYLRGGRKFEHKPDQLIVEGDLWEHLAKDEAYQARRRADRDSLWFDEIIERFCRDAIAGTLEPGSTMSDTERLVRVMARESRFNRRILGKSFKEFYDKAAKKEIDARMAPSPSGVVYVYLALDRTISRELRSKELSLRCVVARGLHPGSTTVIGLATERYEGKPGLSFDGCYLHLPEWTEERQRAMERIQKDCGYFVRAVRTSNSEDEYPAANAGQE